MKTARLYDQPEQFAEMMMHQLRESMGVQVESKEDEPLLLDVILKQDAPEEKIRVSLHETFRTYLAGGDLNVAVDYLNDIVRNSQFILTQQDKMLKLDMTYLYPAIRDARYVLEAGRDCPMVSEECGLPGLRVIFLEIKDGVSKIINEGSLEANPRLTEERVKRIAFRNLRSAGWEHPRLELQSPFRPSCTVEVYTDYSHPIDYQFIHPEMAASNTPRNFVLAFTNRKYALLLRSTENMDTKQKAKRLVEKSKFAEVVKRSFHLLPHPVSQLMYWFHDGKAELLD
ncbi:hypothetical protein [Cohnella candidum]|uniref:DUF1444 family protein n=1 Tax=Cohnella candidum TaxID=2674991 RepID=A0A3G3K3A2_9BACL|nr:hypothetical protein [Cohnella candidum]AYQ74938.1 hypothetical protein EAV92_21705 [Cohnella candidum]